MLDLRKEISRLLTNNIVIQELCIHFVQNTVQLVKRLLMPSVNMTFGYSFDYQPFLRVLGGIFMKIVI